MSVQWDYIIVGAGSAGCVLAERLSRKQSHKVLLLEAGDEDRSPFIHMPKGVAKLYQSQNSITALETEATEASPAERWVRGRVLGGSSSVNGMMYFRGQPQDYDTWEALGGHGWGWDEMARVFRAVEDHELGGADGRGAGGPLGIAVARRKTELTEAVISAGEQMGLRRVEDLNQPDQGGVGYATWTIRNGRRCSAADAFLKPARHRPNLSVETGFVVDRVLFDGARAVGVAGRRNGQPEERRTEGEIILSAGGLVSPMILQRSGVGDPDQLGELGIPVVAESHGVGRNLLEHRLLMHIYKLTKPISDNGAYRRARLAGGALQYLLTRRGRLAEGAFNVGAFVRTRPGLAHPDVEILMSPHALEATAFQTRRDHSLTIFGYPLRSRSQGTMVLQSADPHAPPVIRPNYLSDPYDREISIAMFRYIRRWMQQPALAPLIAEELSPGPEIETDEQILDALLRRGATGMHACGTCAMGEGPDAVVDEKLRVRGVSRLRVVDGSVMPTMPSANTNGPIIAVGWRASELILGDRND